MLLKIFPLLLLAFSLYADLVHCGVISRIDEVFTSEEAKSSPLVGKKCDCLDAKNVGKVDISSTSDQMDIIVNADVKLSDCFESIKESGGFSDSEWDKFQSFRRILQKLAEYIFLGEINSLTYVNPFISDEIIKNGGGEFSPCSSLLFGGDMILTPKQMDDVLEAALINAQLTLPDFNFLFEENYRFSTRIRKKIKKKRSINRALDTRWPFPIIYRAEASVDAEALSGAIAAWERNTCVTFKRTTLDVRRIKGNFINFKDGHCCSSNIGKKTTKSGQTIVLNKGCQRRFSIAHEIGHALGLWHEHSRPDRDSRVTVNTNKIAKDFLGQFIKLSGEKVTSLDLDYDYGSIMHYKSTAFSQTENEKTIEASDLQHQQAIGQRQQLSFYDIETINKAYCSDVCKNKLDCKHQGYPDPKDCSRCRCPEGLGGETCNKVEESPCGADLVAKSSAEKITVEGRSICYWRIKSSSKVKITIADLNFQCRRTCTDFVELKIDRNFAKTGGRYCCAKPDKSFTSGTDIAVVIYKGRKTGKLVFEYSST